MDNYIWYIVAVVVAVIALITAYKVLGINKVTQWLLWAVCEAEKQLGSNTGKLKLSKVYAELIKAFPVFSKMLPFWIFSKLVDEALVVVRGWLESNTDIAKAIIKDGDDECQ